MKNSLSVISFWLIISLLITIVVTFYYLPANSKLEGSKQKYTETDTKLREMEHNKKNLENELIAMDDPFYIEKLLRTEYNYQPKKRINNWATEVSKTNLKTKN